ADVTVAQKRATALDPLENTIGGLPTFANPAANGQVAPIPAIYPSLLERGASTPWQKFAGRQTLNPFEGGCPQGASAACIGADTPSSRGDPTQPSVAAKALALWLFLNARFKISMTCADS